MTFIFVGNTLQNAQNKNETFGQHLQPQHRLVPLLLSRSLRGRCILGHALKWGELSWNIWLPWMGISHAIYHPTILHLSWSGGHDCKLAQQLSRSHSLVMTTLAMPFCHKNKPLWVMTFIGILKPWMGKCKHVWETQIKKSRMASCEPNSGPTFQLYLKSQSCTRIIS